jgi:RNA polymerase sigma-70 factor (ECF subfamily)
VTKKLKDLTDTEVAVRAQNGVVSAFEEIYNRHAAGVARALATFAGPDRDLLDDLTQDVFFRVIKGLKSYTPSQPFTHWLYTVALNVGRNHARGQSKVVPVDPSGLDGIAHLREEPTNWSDDIMANTLMRLTNRLPSAIREVVALRVASGMSYGEIAEVLGIPEGTARRRMFNAVDTLREYIGVNDRKRSERK